MLVRSILRSAALLLLVSGCVVSSEPGFEGEDVGDNMLSFEEFEASTPRSPRTGAYVVEGDLPIHGVDALREYYDENVAQQGELRVSRKDYVTANSYYASNVDQVWSSTAKMSITYCVTTAFGSRYDDVVSGLATAAIYWEQTADVMFLHRSDQDGNCTNSNNNVVFNVVPMSGTNLNASAFFPSHERAYRELEVDTGNAWNDACQSFKGIMMHELGHVLGFTHEHAGLGCTSETTTDTRAVTSYDKDSVMHYANCNGSGCHDYEISDLDEVGSQSIYGAPGLWSSSRYLTQSGGYQSEGKWVTGDFNGDGKDDVAVAFEDGSTNKYSIDAYLSNGSSFTKYRFTTQSGTYQSEGKWVAGDFNGDGKDDVAVAFEDGSSGKYSINAYLSNGSSFTYNRWTTQSGTYQSEGQWLAGDFNADGKDDVAVTFNDGSSDKYSINAYLSSGLSFAYNRWLTKTGNYQSQGKWVAGDFNGDGKDDVAIAFNDGSSGNYSVNAYLSSGSSFGYNRWLTKVGDYHSSAQWSAGDADGDGKDDLIKVWDHDDKITLDVELSFGSGFGWQRWDTKDGSWKSTGKFVAGDFDGDGKVDVVHTFSDNSKYTLDVFGL